MLAHGRPSGPLRHALGLPRWLYRLHLGWVLGHRFLLLTHRGRTSGRSYHSVVEVIQYDPRAQESVVLSGWGERADWYRNLQAAPALEVETGGRRYVPVQRLLTPDEVYAAMRGYVRRNRWAAGLVTRLIGLRFDGSAGDRAGMASLRAVAFRPPTRPIANATRAAGSRPVASEARAAREKERMSVRPRTNSSSARPSPAVPVSPPEGLRNNYGFGLPRADTGNPVLNAVSDAMVVVLHAERRIDPWIRPAFDAAFRAPLTRLTTALINARRPDQGLRLAEEQAQPGEAAFLDDIVATMGAQMRKHWKPGYFERDGNTKTHGLVRGEVIIRDDLPAHMRRGIFAQPRTYPAWVRFSGPGPYVTPDIDDVGFMSISVKLMGVPGPKLLDDERFTQDMFGVSTPTFVTPDTKANAQLQHWSYQNASIYYFYNLTFPHILDSVMQFLWVKTQSSPLEDSYFSCVPYLLGEGQAMQYSFRPRLTTRTPVPNLPSRPPDNYLRDAMVATLAQQDVEFDILVQVQTDSHLMPIENNAVLWPEELSPRVPAAVLRIPRQRFDSPEQFAFAKVLSFNPWHCIAGHRPLGNQNRARLRLYSELARLRQTMNDVGHYEPTGGELFPDSP